MLITTKRVMVIIPRTLVSGRALLFLVVDSDVASLANLDLSTGWGGQSPLSLSAVDGGLRVREDNHGLASQVLLQSNEVRVRGWNGSPQLVSLAS